MPLDRLNEGMHPFSPSQADDSVCAELYQLYAPSLLAYLYRHLPSPEEAEDHLLTVFLVALEHEQKLAPMGTDEQRAWLWTVARNKVIDYQRRVRLRRLLSLEEAQILADDEQKGPEEVMMRAEDHARLLAYMQTLPATQQEVVQLRFTAGMRCAEIATVLNKREGAIRTMLSRALNTLRSLYMQRDKGAS